MNQDIRDALARLTHAVENEARANDLLRIRLEEQEQIVTRERGRADDAERDRNAFEDAHGDTRQALHDLYGAVLRDMTARDLPHEWSPDSAMARASAALHADRPPIHPRTPCSCCATGGCTQPACACGGVK